MLSTWEDVEQREQGLAEIGHPIADKIITQKCWCCTGADKGSDHIENLGFNEARRRPIKVQTNKDPPKQDIDQQYKQFQMFGNTMPTPASNHKSDQTDPSAQSKNFSGSWICAHVSGDMTSYLQDLGLTRELCAAAEIVRYGAGVQAQHIEQDGNSITIKNVYRSTVTMTFQVGAGKQPSVDQEGKPLVINPTWDGNTLCVVTHRLDGEFISSSRRYFQNENMILELKSLNGIVVQRVFSRQT